MTRDTISDMNTLQRFLISFGTSLITVCFNQQPEETGKLNHHQVPLLSLIKKNFSQKQLIGKKISNSETERTATCTSLILARVQDRLTAGYILCSMAVVESQNPLQNKDTMTLQLKITL